jgi:hypothetical protein
VKKNIPRSTSWPIICDLCFLQRWRCRLRSSGCSLVWDERSSPPTRKRCMVTPYFLCLVNLLRRTCWYYALVIPCSGVSVFSLMQLARRYRLPIRSISFCHGFSLVFPVE